MADTCAVCQLVHPPAQIEHSHGTGVTYSPDPQACLAAQKASMVQLLKLVAFEQRPCSQCGAALYMVTHVNGKKGPYTAAGLNHFLDCPHADKFRRPKG